jgi:hypothetical protein
LDIAINGTQGKDIVSIELHSILTSDLEPVFLCGQPHSWLQKQMKP